MNPRGKNEGKCVTRSENLRLQEIWGQQAQQMRTKFAKPWGNKKMPVLYLQAEGRFTSSIYLWFGWNLCSVWISLLREATGKCQDQLKDKYQNPGVGSV